MPKRVADVRSHPQQAIEDERLGSFRDQTTSTQALQRYASATKFPLFINDNLELSASIDISVCMFHASV